MENFAPIPPEAARRVRSIPKRSDFLRKLNYDVNGLRSKSWEEFSRPGAPQLDFVFTVCDSAAAETCPLWPGQPMTAHWGVPDPAAATGNDAEIGLAFADAYRMLNNRISIFVSLPIGSLDKLSLQKRMGRNWKDKRWRYQSSPGGVMSAAAVPLSQRILAEALGTAILVATVVGSGIMADKLAGGNQAVALLGNTIPTGAILVVLITILGPVSGAHLNPAVSLVFGGPQRNAVGRSDPLYPSAVRGRHLRHGDRASDVRSRAADDRHGRHAADQRNGLRRPSPRSRSYWRSSGASATRRRRSRGWSG